jgi:hypothetical protein
VPDTFIKIASVTVGSGGASTIDFTSIPSTYTDLFLKISGRNTQPSSILYLTFNGSTSGYSYRRLYGNGSSAASDSASSTSSIAFIAFQVSTYTANTFSSSEVYVPNYAGSNHKSVSIDEVTENNATLSVAALDAGLWANTAAITSITLTPDSSGNFAQYSTATLYGIKNS